MSCSGLREKAVSVIPQFVFVIIEKINNTYQLTLGYVTDTKKHLQEKGLPQLNYQSAVESSKKAVDFVKSQNKESIITNITDLKLELFRHAKQYFEQEIKKDEQYLEEKKQGKAEKQE